MTKYHYENVGAELRRRFIEALSRNEGHMNRRRAHAPHVANPRRTRGGEDSGEVRTRLVKQGRGLWGGENPPSQAGERRSKTNRWGARS